MRAAPRRLVLILGDQLAHDHPGLASFDPAQDRVLMIEAPGEAVRDGTQGSGLWSHKARIVLCLSAMRHFAHTIKAREWPLTYFPLERDGPASLCARLAEVLARLAPQELVLMAVGDWALAQDLAATAQAAGVPLTWLDDPHEWCSRQDFARWAKGRRQLRMEDFYRHMRRRTQVLMDGQAPVGGRWNFDADNRKGFGRQGPGVVPPPPRFAPDAITQEVMRLVQTHFADHPGSLAHFAWPVTREQALAALQDFVQHRLASFGPWQDAMWTDLPFGWHALLASSLNLHLLDPREVVAAALAAWRAQDLPLASVEGFVRQVLGWREFVRGVYWLDMPGMAQANALDHQRPLPPWYWDGRSRMACMRAAIGQTLAHGYAHHIQRLMITGQFALLAQVQPQALSRWYRSVYVDALEWVEMPNTLGMALHATGARMTSKPYVASGQYVARMSNYCQGCAYQSALRSGPQACPMTVLYWAYLLRHEATLAGNPRMSLVLAGLKKMGEDERRAILAQADALLAQDDLGQGLPAAAEPASLWDDSAPKIV